MDTNRYFSFSRIGLVMRRDMVENWKTNLYGFLGIFFGFLMVYLSMMDSSALDVNAYIEGHKESFALITVFAMFLGASLIMQNMQTKEMRLSYLMLPATSLEKFVARAFYVTIGLLGMILVASLLAEAIHWLFLPLFDLPKDFQIFVWPEAWGQLLADLNPFKTIELVMVNQGDQLVEKSRFGELLFLYMIVLWWHSLYILGGNLWYKWAFVKTTAAQIGISLALVCIGVNTISIDSETIERLMAFFQSHEWITEGMVTGVCALVFFVFTLFNWWLSYRIFTRSQIIKPKFRLS